MKIKLSDNITDNGKAFRNIRLENMASMDDVANASDIKRLSVIRYEFGRNDLKFSTVVRMFDSLGYDIVAVERED